MSIRNKMALISKLDGAKEPGDDVQTPPPNTLEVGHTADTFEVVVNHPDLQPDANGVGHIVFSPDQATEFARILIRHANLARMRGTGLSLEEAEAILQGTSFGE